MTSYIKHQSLMNSKVVISILCFLVGMSPFSVVSADTIPSPIKLSSEQCVTLNQGQVCYQKIRFRWKLSVKKMALLSRKSNTNKSICLSSNQTKKVLKCWKNTNSGKYQIDFQSSNDVIFTLHTEDMKTPLARTAVKVVWVYQYNPRVRKSWRLF